MKYVKISIISIAIFFCWMFVLAASTAVIFPRNKVVLCDVESYPTEGGETLYLLRYILNGVPYEAPVRGKETLEDVTAYFENLRRTAK